MIRPRRVCGDADYVIVADPMPVSQAIREFPEHEESIRSMGQEGQLLSAFSSVIHQNNLSQQFTDVDFERRMVIVVRAWLRHQEIPVDPDAALADQLIQINEDGTFINADGEEITPGSEGWPTKSGILQVTTVGDVHRGPWPEPVR